MVLVVGFFFVVMVVRVCMSERDFFPFGQSLSLSFFLAPSLSPTLFLSLCVASLICDILSLNGALHYGLTVGICTKMEEDKYSTYTCMVWYEWCGWWVSVSVSVSPIPVWRSVSK